MPHHPKVFYFEAWLFASHDSCRRHINRSCACVCLGVGSKYARPSEHHARRQNHAHACCGAPARMQHACPRQRPRSLARPVPSLASAPVLPVPCDPKRTKLYADTVLTMLTLCRPGLELRLLYQLHRPRRASVLGLYQAMPLPCLYHASIMPLPSASTMPLPCLYHAST